MKINKKILSFIVWNIELYAKKLNISSIQVYKQFMQNGIIDLLKENYDDLHSMSFEYLFEYIYKYNKGIKR